MSVSNKNDFNPTLRVIVSGAFAAAYQQLVPVFEQNTGICVQSFYGSSMGGAQDSIPSRFERGEFTDVVIMAKDAIDRFVACAWVQPDSQRHLVQSRIGMAVRAGTEKPDISCVESLTRTILNAESIAYSASASGTYLSSVLFKQLGVESHTDRVAKRIFSERVGHVVARGEAQIGFQQVSELLPIHGIDFVAPLPEAVQCAAYFSAGIVMSTQQTQAAQALIDFLCSPAAATVVRQTGLEPINHH